MRYLPLAVKPLQTQLVAKLAQPIAETKAFIAITVTASIASREHSTPLEKLPQQP